MSTDIQIMIFISIIILLSAFMLFIANIPYQEYLNEYKEYLKERREFLDKDDK